MDDHRDLNEAPVRKKARVLEDIEDFRTMKKRTEALTRKIQDLAIEYPELKYILDLSDLQKIIEPAVTKYKYEVQSDKKRQENEATSPIYVLPDEMIAKCFSYLKGSYLLVAPVSIKFYKVYKAIYADTQITNEVAPHVFEIDISNNMPEKKICKTTFEVAATNTSTAKYCLEKLKHERSSRDKRKKLFRAAALKGRLDVLKLAKRVDILHFWDYDEESKRPISEIAQAGHLHILQSLKNDFNLGDFLAANACLGAVSGGHIHILEWLKSIDCLRDFDTKLCYTAMWFGQLKTLKWLRSEGFDASQLNRRNAYMTCAIWSKNIDFISYCKEEGFNFNRDHSHDIAAIKTDDMDVVKFCFENGCEFSSEALSIAAARNLLDICKFLRSKSVQWAQDAMEYVLQSKSLDMLKFAHEDGCVWSQETWKYCMLVNEGINWDMMNYLYDKKCPWKASNVKIAEEGFLMITETEQLGLVKFIISKKLPWEEKLLLQCIQYRNKRATRALVENTPSESLPKSLSYIARALDFSLDFDMMKSLYSMGIPFGEGLLKKFCGYTSSEKLIEISKWALQNSYEIQEDEIYMVSCQTMFDIDILRLLYTNSELPLEMVVKRCFRDKHYKKGFRSEQFQLLLDLGCTLTKSLTKTILKCWVSNPGNDVLQDIVAILLDSEHPQLSIDEIYMNEEEIDNDESDQESDDDDVINMDGLYLNFEL